MPMMMHSLTPASHDNHMIRLIHKTKEPTSDGILLPMVRSIKQVVSCFLKLRMVIETT